ncbi:MAG: hypothetical protein F6K42_22590 [Leptolyngbya sp. SIO1D8]|nr:hypothetical protein [Leptolyngbya sp. SIO1D8]
MTSIEGRRGIAEAISEVEADIRAIESPHHQQQQNTEELQEMAKLLVGAAWIKLEENQRRDIYQALIEKIITSENAVEEVRLRF